AALDGRAQALDRLAADFLERFYRKARSRCEGHFPSDRAEQALRRVARGDPTAQGDGSFRQDWSGRMLGAFNESEARLLYEEALSYGLIRLDQNDTWRWRHAFVGHFLTRSGGLT